MTIRPKAYLLIFLLPAVVLIALIGLRYSGLFDAELALHSNLIILDLLITIPLLFFILIRKTEIPKFTIVYSFVIGLLVARVIIPTEHHSVLDFMMTYILPIVEIGIVSIVLYKLFLISRSFNSEENSSDFFDKLTIACCDIVPDRIGKLLATEIAVFYYLFSNKNVNPEAGDYSYHKKSGIKIAIGVIIFILIIELFIMHMIVVQWSSTIAWVLTVLSGYACLQIIAIIRSMSSRPIVIDSENRLLKLRYGFANSTNIPFNQIAEIKLTSRSAHKSANMVSLSVFDMLESHNLIIYLNASNILEKLYGLKKEYNAIGVFVDEKEKFVNTLNESLKQGFKK